LRPVIAFRVQIFGNQMWRNLFSKPPFPNPFSITLSPSPELFTFPMQSLTYNLDVFGFVLYSGSLRH
jgi:hypothetical protein